MQLFQQTETDTDLYPGKDPEVIRLQAAVQAARDRLTPAAEAWKHYCAEHCDETISIPFSRFKQRLFDAYTDVSWDVDDAEEALRPAVEAATVKARAAWDDIVRQQFLDDQPAIEQFIDVLRKHEQTVIAAELAGVPHVLNVAQSFLSADEVATRVAYAKQALGVS